VVVVLKHSTDIPPNPPPPYPVPTLTSNPPSYPPYPQPQPPDVGVHLLLPRHGAPPGGDDSDTDRCVTAATGWVAVHCSAIGWMACRLSAVSQVASHALIGGPLPLLSTCYATTELFKARSEPQQQQQVEPTESSVEPLAASQAAAAAAAAAGQAAAQAARRLLSKPVADFAAARREWSLKVAKAVSQGFLLQAQGGGSLGVRAFGRECVWV